MGIWDDLESFGGGVEKWGDALANGAVNTAKWGIGEGVGLVQHTEDSFTSIISIPLILIAGGIALFLWNSDAGQVAEATKNIAPLALAA